MKDVPCHKENCPQFKRMMVGLESITNLWFAFTIPVACPHKGGYMSYGKFPIGGQHQAAGSTLDSSHQGVQAFPSGLNRASSFLHGNGYMLSHR